MKTAIMTDNSCGVSRKEASAAGIFMTSIPVIIDDETFYDMDFDEFFAKQYSDHKVTTSQPSPAEITDSWDSVLEQGYDEILYMPISSGYSESYSTAMLLSQDYDGKVVVVNNHRIAFTLWSAATQAKAMADSGKTAAEIRDILEADSYNASIYVVTDTLEFLKKGGRVTPAVAALGTVLGIKPVLTMQGDDVDSFAKARGMNKAIPIIIKALKDDIENRFHWQDSDYGISAVGAGLTEDEKSTYMKAFSEAFPNHKIDYHDIPLVICVHSGKGAIGVGVYHNIDL